MPTLAEQEESEVRRLLPGVWKLDSIDGHAAYGWLTFRDNERGGLSFSLICGQQDGSYALEGNTVIPDLRTSVGPNCDSDMIASSEIRVPELLFRPFQVNVGAQALTARGQHRTGPTWARYVRSSSEEWLRAARRNR